MPREPKVDASKLLTATELEIMSILWRLDGGSVQEVLQALPPRRALARTSVSTMLRILEAKAFVASVPEGRAHRYRPLLSKADYEARSVEHLVSRVFEGSASTLMRRLIDTHDLDRAELEALRALLEQKGVRT
jgi:predicted transcriptional regulator